MVLIIRQQRKNIELQKANAMVEISAMEKERARIAADLHDDLAPVLAVIKFRINNILSLPKDELDELNKASNHIDDIIVRLREVSNNLLPTVLQRKGVGAAIEEFLSTIKTANNLKIEVRNPDIVSELKEDKGIQIFRIAQESVNNCIKHANSKSMQIIFRRNKNMLTMICQDNGIGIDLTKDFDQFSGRGLISMRNRTELMGGSLIIESEKGKGTILQFEIPII